jgi:spore maturation protein CgeB
LVKILCVGEEWRGSNASGLFYALSRIGHQIELVNELNYISLNANGLKTKLLNKMVRRFQIADFNRQIIDKEKQIKPDFILIYKGAFIFPETIKVLKGTGVKVVNFYPDVSLFAHGSLIPKTIHLYDHIFTTKTFAINDLKEKFSFNKVTFIPHGFDALLHNRLKQKDHSAYTCDVSFIGTWSPKKENLLTILRKELPQINLKIWGNQWDRAKSKNLYNAIQNAAVIGDQYVEAIQHSKINLGILSERRKGSSSGDLITSRTFHIPASGGFMLHEKTEEVINYFEEGKEMICYENTEDLILLIRFYLANEIERVTILTNGYNRAIQDHSLNNRAEQLVSVLYKYKIIKP